MATLNESLLQWVNTFQDVDVETFGGLNDGVSLFQICHQIEPAFFDPSSAKQDVGDNWILKQQNLSKLTSAINEYYTDNLGQDGDACADVDLKAVAGGDDEDALASLVNLVLGVAVLCDQKDTYVRNIMDMDQAFQQQLMIVIQELIGRSSSFGTPKRRRTNSSMLGLETPEKASEAIEAKNAEIGSLTEEINSLRLENSTLKQNNKGLEEEKHNLSNQLKDAEGSLQNLSGDHAASQNKASEDQEKFDKLKAELDAARAAKDDAVGENHDLKGQLEDLQKALDEGKKRAEELSRASAENQHLTDELDVYKSKVDDLEKKEETLEKYKKKLESAGDIKKQLKDLEAENEKYIEKNLDLEEQLRKLPSLKTQIDHYKSQVAKLETSSAEFQASISEKDFELSKLQEKVDKMTTEHQHAVANADSLKKKMASLQEDQDGATLSARNDSDAGASLQELATPDLKAKLMRLERENASLRGEGGGGDDGMREMLESQLEDANTMKIKFQQDYLSVRTEVASLTSRVKEVEAENLAKSKELEIALETSAAGEHDANKNLSGISSKVKDLEKEKTDLQSALELAQKELFTTKKSYNVLAKEKGELTMDLQSQSDLTSGLGNLEKENIALQAKVEELTQAKDALSAEKVELTSNLAKKEEENETLATSDKEHLREISSLFKEKDDLNKTLLDTKEKLIDLERQISSSSAKGSEAAFFKEQLEKAQADGQETTAKLQNVQVELKAAQEAITVKEKEVLEVRLQHSEQANSTGASAGGNTGELAEKLKAKQSECEKLLEDKKRLEVYMHQARQVVQDLSTRTKDHETRNEVESQHLEVQYKAMIQKLEHEKVEMEKELAAVKKSRDDARKSAEEEQKLIISAFYEIGLELQRVKQTQPAAGQQQKQQGSWLSKMRGGGGQAK